MTSHPRPDQPSFLARLEPHLAPRFGSVGSISLALATLRRRGRR